jgi:2-keto-4-pentenoate hydratase
MTTVPDDDKTAAAASRDAVATNATNAANVIGPRGARDLRAAAETW